MITNAVGIEVFTGFNIKYPEYSVITPHTLKEFTIRSLTVAEEEKMKSSLLTPNKLAEHLNEVIWQCLVKKPDDVKTYDDFLKLLTIKDRDALMYGLYHVTYKDIHDYDVVCPKCDHTNSVKIDFLKSFQATMWPDINNSILEKKVPVTFEIANNITAYIKQPLLVDEYNLLKNSAFVADEIRDLNMQLLIIDRFEVDREESKTPYQLLDRDNIAKGFKELPSTDKKAIDTAYEENFGKYGVEIKSIIKCQRCGNEELITIDLVRQFFRAMYE